jgi:predicted regulator of Ras-like GTPase activity (Roadblock/LC7/MglB family)
VDPSGSVNFYTSITIGGDGLPIISCYDANSGNLKVIHCNDVACAGQDESVTTVDPAAENVGFTSAIAIGRDGLPIVSYQEDNPLGNASLRVAHCNDPACAGQDETITEVETFAILTSHGRYSSIAISPDGFPSASYVRGQGDLSFMRCNDPLCTGSNESLQLVDPAVPCSYSSMTFGLDGFPIISYHDENSGARDLKVAHCTDLACATKNVTIVHSTGIVGEYTAIAIGADGLPIISYFDQSAGVLRVAHCNDVACSGNATLVVVDDPISGNIVGLFTSIAIGADGLPIIAYFDQTAEALKVAHCANVYCAPFFHRR